MIELVKTTGKVDLSIAQDYKAGYEAGKGAGYLDGYYNGRAEGVEARDLEWWAKYQGIDGSKNSTWYHYMFAGSKWDKETFKPHFDIKVYTDYQSTSGNANSIFQNHNHDEEPYDLAEHLENLGVELDTSKFAAMVSAFNAACVSRLPAIDLTALTGSYNSSSIFASKYIETIDKLIMKERTFDYYNNEFSGATALKNITIEGVIANNKLNFSACPLTHDSLMSIINHLKDFSGTTTTRSITFGAANLAKLTDAEKAKATEKGWSLA